MTSHCGKYVSFPRKLERLPVKLKKRVFHEIFKEEKVKVDETYEKNKSRQTNHTLLFNKPKEMCDTSGRQKVETIKHKKNKTSMHPTAYINFLQSSDKEIVSWKSNLIPETDMIDTDHTICQQMDVKVEQIIKEFVDFWTELGSNCCEEEKAKNRETMRCMFAIDFDEHISRALVNIPKELMCVPAQVAAANCQPQASISYIIKRIVEFDIEAERQDKRTIGFGRGLPKELCNVPPSNKTKERWIDIDAIPPDLVNMSTVWQGIAHLKSSFGFYHWLDEKWDKQIPEYLKDFYDNNPDVEPTADVKDLLVQYQISETMLPVLRDEEQGNIEELKRKAFENL